MPRLINITQASEATGLSPYQLRAGARAGRYPHIRAGGEKHGAILFNLDMLEAAIKRQMLENMTDASASKHSGAIRAVQ